MPKTIKNEDGTEEEVFTQEEVDQAAAEKAQAEREAAESEKQAEIDRLNEEREAEQEELEKLRNKDMNFEKLRSKNNKPATNADGETAEDIAKKLEDTNKRIDEVVNQGKTETLNDFIKSSKIGEDKEKKDKFDHYYKKLGSDAKTKEEIQEAAEAAYKLATGNQYDGSNDQSIHSTGTDLNYREQNAEASAEAKSMGEQLGVTEEDRKKYSKKK